MQKPVIHTRYLDQNDAQIKELLEILFVPESIPDTIDSFHSEESKLIILGTSYHQPIKISVTKDLLTQAARKMGSLQKDEVLVGFGRRKDSLVFLIKKTEVKAHDSPNFLPPGSTLLIFSVIFTLLMLSLSILIF